MDTDGLLREIGDMGKDKEKDASRKEFGPSYTKLKKKRKVVTLFI